MPGTKGKSRDLSGRVPLAERDAATLTPLQKQYYEIKKQHQGCLLFFRLGDFYELFDEDAVLASRELDLMLTTRDRNKPVSEQMPMCGVPYHSSEAYISRLLQKGYKVAVCEQLEDPATAKGLVKRDVIRVITPGTVTESSMLEGDKPNYVCAICVRGSSGGMAFCDVSTGEFFAMECKAPVMPHILNELSSFTPREVVLNAAAGADKTLADFLRRRIGCSIEQVDGYFDASAAAERLDAQFSKGANELPEAATDASLACGALLQYISDTQKCDMAHINRLEFREDDRYMELDWQTRRSLELTANLRTGAKAGSLLGVLDRTKTPMGARTLRSWVEMPLLKPQDILQRLAAVRELKEDNVLRGELGAALDGIGDMQRVASRLGYQSANGRDLLALAASCEALPRIKELLSGRRSVLLSAIADMDALEDVREEILGAIHPDAPVTLHDGGLIRPGYSQEVDHLRDVMNNSASLLAEMQQREIERTGIKKLRIAYNRVFGYYIDIPGKVPAEELPSDYIRKQTLVNHERYFTAELKTLESEISSANENDARLEYTLFCEVRAKLAARLDALGNTAALLSVLDALRSLAEVAVRNGYVCPEIDDSGVIEIRDGRHPVVEYMQKDTRFVPNDTYLNLTSDRLAVITGPNMAGKSTYMRQTALIVLMAQMGSFVPARSASIGVVDRVFTRIGSSDNLAGGQSTFMVEMLEVAQILKAASSRSLIILDEIGRGTSTYDGVAIARAVLEYCADKRRLGAKTLLATHYHELTELAGHIDGVKNYSITAKKQSGGIIFLRRIVPGAADESYGIEVASLAGVPDSVVRRAKECLAELVETSGAPRTAAHDDAGPQQMTLGDGASDEVLDAIRSAKLDTLTPIEAMNLLYQLQRKLAP